MKVSFDCSKVFMKWFSCLDGKKIPSLDAPNQLISPGTFWSLMGLEMKIGPFLSQFSAILQIY